MQSPCSPPWWPPSQRAAARAPPAPPAHRLCIVLDHLIIMQQLCVIPAPIPAHSSTAAPNPLMYCRASRWRNKNSSKIQESQCEYHADHCPGKLCHRWVRALPIKEQPPDITLCKHKPASSANRQRSVRMPCQNPPSPHQADAGDVLLQGIDARGPLRHNGRLHRAHLQLCARRLHHLRVCSTPLIAPSKSTVQCRACCRWSTRP